MRRLRERLTFANVTAAAALFIALGGTSYAAITLPRNSVGANQLRSSAVRSSEVKDRSLGLRDMSASARRALRGARGPQGPPGQTGPTGAGGTGGGGGGGTTTTTTLPITTETASESIDRQAAGEATATCGAGRKVTGGAVRIDSPGDNEVRSSHPNAAGTAWIGRVENGDDPPPVGEAGPFTFTVIAICAG